MTKKKYRKRPGQKFIERNKFVFLERSRLHGHGLFARRNIPKGTEFVEYSGPRISKREGKRMVKEGNVYIFSLNRINDIDGSLMSNLARYANHSCYPNAESVQDGDRIWLTAMRDIFNGEEITYDYCYTIKEYEENPCQCRHLKCIGYIVHHRFNKKIREKKGDRHQIA